MEQISILTYINGNQSDQIIINSKNISQEIINYIEKIKSTNTSAAALYNSKEQILDIVQGTDEINTVSKLSSLVKTYPYDLFDTSVYAIINSAYARKMIGFINAEFKFMKFIGKKEKHVSLIKKAVY